MGLFVGGSNESVLNTRINDLESQIVALSVRLAAEQSARKTSDRMLVTVLQSHGLVEIEDEPNGNYRLNVIVRGVPQEV